MQSADKACTCDEYSRNDDGRRNISTRDQANLAGYVSIEQYGQPADERLGDCSRSSLGHDRVASVHVLVDIVDEPRRGHRHPARVTLGAERLEQLPVTAADDDDLAASSQLLRDLIDGDLELAHALATAHQQDRRQIRAETQGRLHSLLGWQTL